MPSDIPNQRSDYQTILEKELEEIGASQELRAGRGIPKAPKPADGTDLLGLAFSGGGIRSATFGLGVLQALAGLKLLRSFDYLSTVSGGGYVGSWLVSWIKRHGMAEVEDTLGHDAEAGRAGEESKAVNWLRQFSNYLTPKLGLFSADTWTVAAVWLRNTLLNLLVICSGLVAVLTLPWFIAQAATAGNKATLAWVALSTMVVAGIAIGFSLRAFDDADRKTKGLSQSVAQLLIIAPVLVSAFCASTWWARMTEKSDDAVVAAFVDLKNGVQSPAAAYALAGQSWNNLAGLFSGGFPAREPDALICAALGFGLAIFLLFVLSEFLGRFWRCFDPEPKRSPTPGGITLRAAALLLMASAIPSVMAGLLLLASGRLFAYLGTHGLHVDPQHGDRVLAIAGVPVILAILTLAVILHLGLMGRNYPDERREWWSRLGAWVAIYLVLWGGGALITFAGKLLFDGVLGGQINLGKLAKSAGAIATWIGTTGAGVWASMSPRSGKVTGDEQRSNSLVDIVALVAPPLSLVLLLLPLAAGVDAAQSAVGPLPLLAAALAVCFGISLRVDVNEFSMHHFYKNRLVRCYLGATHDGRSPNRFTGFDPCDDVPLESLSNLNGQERSKDERCYDGPYPILNTTLNLAAGEQIGWQERKGNSFIFTPRFCGFSARQPEGTEYAYRPTEYYAKRGGLSVGTPLAISGAAVSPNWGYHTSSSVAFFLTVFNVRLGWWLGNPLQRKWTKSGPRLGLLYLFTELLGMASSRRHYVYLSDGGHFDNMGLYELVRRRCRYIVLCDGEEDHAYTFGGLGNAIRKCRTDLGAEIEISLDRLRPQKDKPSASHVAVGRILYDNGLTGTLVYLKSTLTGDEAGDILEYASRNREFPHQTTADQFFDESQFESYRKLGYHIGRQTFAPVAAETRIQDREAFFVALQQFWYPAARTGRAAFLRHANKLDTLFERQRRSPHLGFLDTQIYPEWEPLEQTAVPLGETAPAQSGWLPTDPTELREGFYFCNSLIQLMEEVYLDLDLEQTADNPDHRGWMNLFRHWAWAGMFRVTWAISSGTYGARFEAFCHRYLRLERGRTTVDTAPIVSAAEVEHSAALTFLEKSRIKKVLASTGLGEFAVWRLVSEISDPGDPTRTLRFPVGFALATGRRLVYFRIQNHLRRMGLGRDALAQLIDQGIVTESYPPPPPSAPYGHIWSTKERRARFQELFRSAGRLAAERKNVRSAVSGA
ncbi:MAG TPA: patatin-like phospholipase family protein [Bryobacteraceae bacterium]